MKNKKRLFAIVLIVYVAALICGALIFRKTKDKVLTQTEWFWGYTVDKPEIFYGDTLVNILLYIPIGLIAGLIAPKRKLLMAVFLGLFLSETIECSQLIWHRGVFDVDDIFNNTLGALLGGIIALLTIGICKKRTMKS